MKLPKKAMLVLSAAVILSALGAGPAMASRGGGGGDDPEIPELVTICHNDQGVYTLTDVDPEQVDIHLGHGDVYPENGTCPVSQLQRPALVDVCHNEQGVYTLTAVDPDEVSDHLGHGDVTPDANGDCPSDPVVEVAGTSLPVTAAPAEETGTPEVAPVVEAHVTLPRTGGDSTYLAIVGLVLVGAGLSLLTLRRRPSSSAAA